MKNFIYSCFLVLFVTTFLSAQTPIARAVTESVTPHSLTTLGLTTNSVSPGLPVFANGTYVYLSAKEVGNNQPVLTSAFNLFQRPAGSTAVLEDVGSLGWKGLKADVKGAYKVEVTITTATGTDQDTVTLYAGDYIGVGTVDGVPGAFPSCETCHSSNAWFTEIKGRWETSGHATIFRDQVDNSTHYSTSCMKCHTTGYDHNVVASNNGFDDVAASLGWIFSGTAAPGTWANIKTNYPGLVKFGVIGCESCHGAGSNHPSGQPGSEFATLATYRAGACAQCHDEPWRHNKYAQYENSTHADIVFETTTGSSGNTNNLQDCARCHDGRVYIQFTQGLNGTDPGKINVKTLTEANSVDVTCQTCHDPHGNSNFASLRESPASSDTLGNGYAYTLGGTGQICMDCHKNRRNAELIVLTNVSNSHWGPHHSVQTDNFFGQNAATFSGTPFLSNSHQFAVTDACATCHMVATTDTGTVNRDKVGGHSFKMKNEDTGYEHTAACTNCHGPKNSFDEFEAVMDYDGDGSVEGIQSEVDGLLANIRFLLPPTGVDSVSWEMIRDLNDETVKRAYWNYLMEEYDGSRGMHNSKFTFDVLTKTLSALGGVVPVELVSFNAQVGKNGVTLAWETASELNNRGFEVERNYNGTWATIGFVEGKGTTTEYNKYSYNDNPNTLSSVSYRLKQVDFNGQHSYSKVVNVDFGTMPTEFSLSQNYPNPFNPSTQIKFALPFDSKVKVTIYSINGEVVKVLVDGEYTAGVHSASFSTTSGNGLSSGIYLYSITAVSNDGKSNFTQTKKMVLLK